MRWTTNLTILLVALAGYSSQVAAQSPKESSPLATRVEMLEAEIAKLRHTSPYSVLPTGHTLGSALPGDSCNTPNPIARTTKYPTARLTGFLQADTGWFHQDAANRIAVGDVQDGADFRRARLAATGDVAENVGYMAEFDFAFPARPGFMDVWLEVRDTSLLNDVKVGLYRQPIGLDGLTSVKELTFLERGLPFAFLPFRQIGAMTSGADEERGVTWALSGFRFPTDPFGGQIGDSGGYGMATRLTRVIAEDNDGSVIHIGGAYSLIDPANDAVRYRAQPEFFVAETGGAAFVPSGVPTGVPPFVDTGVLPAEKANLFAAEFAATSGQFHAQSEFIHALVSREGATSVGFSGVSAQAACILTGEHRPYNRKAGVLGRVVPSHDFGKSGYGAWEVAARWSMLDLDDGDVRGGTLNTSTLGLNWYLNKFTKFQFNYIHAFLNSPVNGDSDADVFAVRAQVDF
jgi:phosphate-selective porin OprO/OprP